MLLETIQGKSVSRPSRLAGEVGKLDNRVLRSLRRGEEVGGGVGGAAPGPTPGFILPVPQLVSSPSWLVREIVADSWKSFTQIFCFFPL